MIQGGQIFNLSILLMGLSLPAIHLKGKTGSAIAVTVFWAAAALGLAYIVWRYWLAWPKTPMYLGTAALPPVLALAAWFSARSATEDRRLFILRRALGLCFLTGAASVLFPKDFYLPFLKTISIFSHLHLLFTVLGKAALILAGLWAWAGLDPADDGRFVQNNYQTWLMLGFALWTLCMFSGEIWSYRGWGVPVVWDDAVIVCFMATWFYYIGLLHLHLTRSWSLGQRLLAAVFGIALILALNCTHDLGPYRPLGR
jgi:hypothetical protein